MDYQSINWKPSYTTGEDNLIQSFYSPAIELAVSYKRLTGFFSAIFLENLVTEIKSSSKHNNMKISIVCSPEMKSAEIEDIKLGYEIRELIERKIIETIESFNEDKADTILPIISDLIANKVLDIKFAIPKNSPGMFHAKNGIFTDTQGNKIAFTGSNNETFYAVNYNYESFTVLNNWNNPVHINDLEKKFDEIWEGKNETLICKDVTSLIKKEADKRNRTNIVNDRLKKLNIKSQYNLRDYQLTAIDNWKQNGYEGIFEMATGTGKTITALGAIGEVSDAVNKLVTIIVVPQKDLVLQWKEDILLSENHVTLCYGDNPKWPEWLHSRISGLQRKDTGYLHVLVTNDTFISNRFQNIILSFDINYLLVSDEVHSFGADKMRKLYPKLKSLFKFKLGLSATPFRKDEQETNVLQNFFNGVVYNYNLKEAIDNGVLNQYNYSPKIMYYEEELLNQYRKVYYANREQFMKNDLDALNKLDRITTSIANSSTSKIKEVYNSIANREDDYRLIVYCAPGNYNNILKEYDERHIDYVSKILGKIEGVKLRKVRSQVPTDERKEILDQFLSGSLNTLVAIKCLDQGIDLPNVKDAYIMSSFDSETEFIQRRGRILRRYEGKPISNIYDYIMLPQNIESPDFFPDESDAYLVDRELKRMKSYMNGSSNPEMASEFIEKIESAYHTVLEDYYEKNKV